MSWYVQLYNRNADVKGNDGGKVFIFWLAHSSSTSSLISNGDKEKESKMELTDRLVKGEQSTLPQNIHKLRVDL